MAGIGPNLPDHLRKKYGGRGLQGADESSSKSSLLISNKDQGENIYGPSLPAGYAQSEYGNKSEGGDEAEYGPMLPSELGNAKQASSQRRSMIGPTLPSNAKELHSSNHESDDEIVGPLPTSDISSDQSEDESLSRKIEIEERAKSMKDKLKAKSDPQSGCPVKRESWMTELPPELSGSIGITARKFKTSTLSASEADRSVWTDTPADKERKRKEMTNSQKHEKHEAPLSAKELEMQERITEYNQRKRPMSLLDMHQEKRKKEGAGQEKEREPFNRETDLAISKMDAKTKSGFIKKSKDLNSRFHAGKLENKFL